MAAEQHPTIYLFTDGAAAGNPGPGGYGVVLMCGGLRKEMSGGFRLTTNNRMELLAVIKGLEAIKWRGADVQVWSDSSYVVKAITEGWLQKWEAKGLYRAHHVTFNWLKGHDGNPQNERCDALAVEARMAANLPADTEYEAQQQTVFNQEN